MARFCQYCGYSLAQETSHTVGSNSTPVQPASTAGLTRSELGSANRRQFLRFLTGSLVGALGGGALVYGVKDIQLKELDSRLTTLENDSTIPITNLYPFYDLANPSNSFVEFHMRSKASSSDPEKPYPGFIRRVGAGEHIDVARLDYGFRGFVGYRLVVDNIMPSELPFGRAIVSRYDVDVIRGDVVGGTLDIRFRDRKDTATSGFFEGW